MGSDGRDTLAEIGKRMPFIRVVFKAATPQSAEDKQALAAGISRAVSSALGKPEQYVCVHLEEPSLLLFGGTSAPAAHCEVQSIGGDLKALASSVTDLLVAKGIAAERVFVNFTNFAPTHWAMSGNTFA